MTINFVNEEFEITEKEKYDYEPYIGYIDHKGNLINYNKPFGESGHDGWDNMISDTFLQFVSYTLKGILSEDSIIRGMGFFLNENKETFNEFLENLEFYLKYPPRHDDAYGQFKYQILLFFKKAYINKTFFETIGRNIEVISEEEFIRKNILEDPYESITNNYIMYLKKILMQHFKDIVVSYIGYDSIERFQPNGKLIEIPHNWGEFPSFYHYRDSYFYRTPRIITTSCRNINERFYNHLLMGWKIHRIPRYIWNENLQKFEKEQNYMNYVQSEKEEILGEEIKSIKRLVLLKDRYKYFR